jgi:hypothetical protein
MTDRLYDDATWINNIQEDHGQEGQQQQKRLANRMSEAVEQKDVGRKLNCAR